MSREEGRRRMSLLIKHFKQRQPLRRKGFLILRTLKTAVVETEEDMTKGKRNSINKTNVVEDKVEVVEVVVEEGRQTTHGE